MGKKNNLVRNASFLMIAAMISKIIGLLYKSPLSSIVGNMGMGYISLAQNAYMILLMIASFSIPQAVSKLISERIALRDYKNAQKIFRGSMIYAAVVGGAVALFCLFGARFIIPRNQPNAVLACRFYPLPYSFPEFSACTGDIFRHTEICFPHLFLRFLNRFLMLL